MRRANYVPQSAMVRVTLRPRPPRSRSAPRRRSAFATSTIVVAGRISPNTLPCTRATASHCDTSVTYIRVRITCSSLPPSASIAAWMIASDRAVCLPKVGVVRAVGVDADRAGDGDRIAAADRPAVTHDRLPLRAARRTLAARPLGDRDLDIRHDSSGNDCLESANISDQDRYREDRPLPRKVENARPAKRSNTPVVGSGTLKDLKSTPRPFHPAKCGRSSASKNHSPLDPPRPASPRWDSRRRAERP